MSTILELMQTPPEGLKEMTDKDLDEIVKYFRERRALFNAGASQAGSTKNLKSALKASLDDLGL